MTEKLTYDPTPADAPEFTEDEQDSLAVAEKLGQEESELYAGKYQSAEELEEAYINLQKKLGSSEEEDDDEVEETTFDEDEYPEEVAAGVDLITTASEEYYENDGAISEETMQRFTEMSSSDLVEAYMAIRDRNPEIDSGTSVDLTDAEMNQVYNSAGGEAEYERLTSWAAQNISETKLNAFNDMIDRGNATAIQIAVAGLRAEYEAQEGYEGRMLTGKSAPAADGFRSQAEVVQAMSDPRYERDEAYRLDVYNKLERSDIEF